MTGPTAIAEPDEAGAGRELRVYERFPCDVPASCQPPSDWKRGGQKWMARVRDISSGGLCLVLGRRFERGAGLAVELPGRDAGCPSTLLARVMRVHADGAGAWVLGCAFVSPLSDEELEALTRSAARQGAAPDDAAAASGDSVADVLLRATLPGGRVVERMIRKLNRNGQWPLPAGRKIGLRLRDASGADAVVKLRVETCCAAGSRWVLECTIVGAPPAGLAPPT